MVNPKIAKLDTIYTKDTKQVFIKQLFPNTYIPESSKLGAAGFDVKNCHSVKLLPCSVTKIRTGIACEISNHTIYLQVAPQSSLVLRQITIEGGVIHSGFRGVIIILLKITHQNKYA